MSYKVLTITAFEKQAKRLVKKYPSLKNEIFNLINALEVNPLQGVSIGKNCFKIRLSISSKGKGKSGGARVISHFVVTYNTVFLLSIYDKTEKDSLTDKQLGELLSEIDS